MVQGLTQESLEPSHPKKADWQSWDRVQLGQKLATFQIHPFSRAHQLLRHPGRGSLGTLGNWDSDALWDSDYTGTTML